MRKFFNRNIHLNHMRGNAAASSSFHFKSKNEGYMGTNCVKCELSEIPNHVNSLKKESTKNVYLGRPFDVKCVKKGNNEGEFKFGLNESQIMELDRLWKTR